MATVSCIVVTTLIVVSLANLLLLVHVIMHSLSKCDTSDSIMKKIPKIPRSPLMRTRKDSDHSHRFMAALMVLFEDENFEFVCGVAVVSKKWVLTAAHCAEPVLSEDLQRIKISTSAQKINDGLWYDVHKIKVHQKYKSSPVNNLALISIRQTFKDRDNFVPLPTLNYKYLANSNATALGWESSAVAATETKLLPYKTCKFSQDRITEESFCTEKKSCLFDFGGVLTQRGVLIGVLSSGVGCGSKPVLYTRVSMFEEWFRNEKVAATLKD